MTQFSKLFAFVIFLGLEYVGIVEYAPFQRIPKKKKKKDPKCGTIESDPVYQEFVESLNKEPETDNQPKLEYSYPISDGRSTFDVLCVVFTCCVYFLIINIKCALSPIKNLSNLYKF